jgi:hypothetical protein
VTKKISELPIIPGPGTGNEIIPINQNGVTYQSTMVNLMAWMNLSGLITSDGTQAAPGLAWLSEPGMGWWRRGAGQTGFAVNNHTVELVSGDANGQWFSMFPQANGTRVQLTLHDSTIESAAQHQLYLINQSSSYVLGENLVGGAGSVPFVLAFPAGIHARGSINAPSYVLATGGGSFNSDANNTYVSMIPSHFLYVPYSTGVLTWWTPSHNAAFQVHPNGDTVSGRDMYFNGTGGMVVRQDANERSLWFAGDNWRLRWVTANGTLQYLNNTHTMLWQVDGGGNMTAPGINATSYNYATHIRGGAGNPTSGLFNFNWYDDGSHPGYLWGSSDGVNMRVYPPGRLNVSYANSAGTASNSNQVSGVGGWSYSNWGNNPAYIWCTEGDGQAQHLTQPGNLTVNRADNCRWADSAGYCNGTTENSNNLVGRPGGQFIHNNGSACVHIVNSNASWLNMYLGGYGYASWSISGSDSRIKKDIAPTKEDSLSKITQIEFREFRYTNENVDTEYAKDDGHLHKVGVIAQELQVIDPEWIGDNLSTFLCPDTTTLLWEALHAIKQLNAQMQTQADEIAELRNLITPAS